MVKEKLPVFAEKYDASKSSIDGVVEDISGKTAMNHLNDIMLRLTYMLPTEQQMKGLQYYAQVLSQLNRIVYQEKLGWPTGYIHYKANELYESYVSKCCMEYDKKGQ